MAASAETKIGVVNDVPFISRDDMFLFNEGSHFHLYDKLGAHLTTHKGERGTYFAVWAPNAKQVAVIGDFNRWNPTAHLLSPQESSGIWAGFIPNVHKGDLYKFRIVSHSGGTILEKTDPFGAYQEVPSRTASVVWDLQYDWHDHDWIENRKFFDFQHAPVTIYEVHLGSWMQVPEENHRSLTYREIAPKLSAYVKEMGFTHVELMPIMEHPFSGSWGYQTTGYFAPTSRYGTPQDFMFLVDHLHQNGIGVILDWVPSHFPMDGHGLALFDGTHLFEHADPRLGYHPDWKSAIFNYGRHEVRSFLTSSAFCWFDKYHIDGLRVDAVASMLYLDYSRQHGEWLPNIYGGNENLEAISFLRRLNTEVYKAFPGIQMLAEESTAWSMVSKPVYLGGLGFGAKWDMGWMNDTLRYFCKDPIHRRYHQNDLTFRQMYAFTENFVLSLSHDEVVHGKNSLLNKMPGDDWQKFANVRALLGYMYALSGKKLLFMGNEIGQRSEWNYNHSLEWHLLQYEPHRGLQRWVKDLNHAYLAEPALHELDWEWNGFQWMDFSDSDNSVLAFVRRSQNTSDLILAVCNFTAVPRTPYRVGVPRGGFWKELLNSDAVHYGGSGMGNWGGVHSESIGMHNQPCSLNLCLPPMSVTLFKNEFPAH